MAQRLDRGSVHEGSVEDALLRIAAHKHPAAVDLSGRVRLITPESTWTVVIKAGSVTITGQDSGKVDCTVESDSETLAGILTGEESGIEAYLAGRVLVRGSLAMSLRLESLVEDIGRPTHHHHSFSVMASGVKTFFIEAGKGPPVILLHGLGATNASFLPTFMELAKDHHVIAPDLPGHGDTGKPVRRYHAGFFARWLDGFVTELGLDKVTLIGNSMGGRIALEFGLRHPDKVSALILVCPAMAFLRGRELVPIVRYMRAELGVIPLTPSKRRVIQGIKTMFAKPERLRDGWYESAAGEFQRVFSGPKGRIAFFSAAREIYLDPPHGERGLWERLGKLAPPTLFIWGAKDRLVPARFAPHVIKAAPAARSMILEDCGHVPQFEKPEELHSAIRAFLTEIA
ncbi:MAG TPA: alpha/beta fold hydrolase [Actinomycetota bacterium]|nr:alpha/beta fold hydrolase [Actinomycetota bacterium]